MISASFGLALTETGAATLFDDGPRAPRWSYRAILQEALVRGGEGPAESPRRSRLSNSLDDFTGGRVLDTVAACGTAYVCSFQTPSTSGACWRRFKQSHTCFAAEIDGLRMPASHAINP
jgi:hypothetical protein